jgi:hypothetical protein
VTSKSGRVAGLARLLDETESALQPLRFTAEPARTATGPCGCRAGCLGGRSIIAGRLAALDAAGGARAAVLAARVSKLWSGRGLSVQTRSLGSLGHEVIGTTETGDIVVFGVAAAGASLGGETGCLAPAGVTSQEEGMPSEDG